MVELTREHMALVRKIRCRYFKTLPDWEDIEGAGMIGLVEAAIRYKPDSGATFTTYAWRRIHGAMRDHLRGKRYTENGNRIHITEAAPMDSASLEAHSAAHDPISEWELTETLWNAIETLPDKQRTIINLRYLHDMPVADVAKICGLTESTVHVYAMQARRTLRASLDRQALAA